MAFAVPESSGWVAPAERSAEACLRCPVWVVDWLAWPNRNSSRVVGNDACPVVPLFEREGWVRTVGQPGTPGHSGARVRSGWWLLFHGE
jgi:hypothetical protein